MIGRIHYHVDQLAAAELDADEQIVWSATPGGKRAMWKSAPAFLFGIPFTAFAVFWTWAASGMMSGGKQGGIGPFAWFGVPFMLIGAGLLLKPLWAWMGAGRSGYFLTDRRALLIEMKFLGGYRIRQYHGRDMRMMERTERSDGTGDVVFDREVRPGAKRNYVEDIGFFGIRDARTVERMLQEIRDRSTAKPIT